MKIELSKEQYELLMEAVEYYYDECTVKGNMMYRLDEMVKLRKYLLSK